jgi:hypothetical protein
MIIIQPNGLTPEERWMQSRPAVQQATAKFLTVMLVRGDSATLKIFLDASEMMKQILNWKPPPEPDKS